MSVFHERRRATALVLGIAIVAALVPPSTSLAGVSGTSGQAVRVSAPASVAVGAAESDTAILVFDEQHDVTLAAAVAVDAVDPGTYTASASPPPIPAGARVDSYFLHGDRVGETPGAVLLNGSVTFSTEVLGVIFTGPSLNGSDGPLGSVATLYPSHHGRGLEGQDSVTISPDRRSVTVHLEVFGVVDQVRVVTVAESIPVLRDGVSDREDPGGRPPSEEETNIEPVRDGLFETEAPTPEPEGTGEPIPGNYIVTFKPGTAGGRDLSERLVRDNGGELQYVYQHALSGFVARLNERRLSGILRNPNVERVEQDTVMGVAATEEEVSWGLDRIDRRYLPLRKRFLPKRTGEGVTVYVLDTGIQSTHAEFEGRVKPASVDCHGHGTHVAGIVAGKTLGVAKKADIVSRKVFDCTGTGPVSAVIKHLDWLYAYAKRPSVILLSFEGDSVTLDETLRKVIKSGLTVVVAAGNSSKDACTTSPARVAEALTVGATSSADQIADYSNQGPCIDLFAPGSTIRSADSKSDTATKNLSGTSAAAAHVAGVAAMYTQAFPNKTPAEVSKAIVDAGTRERLIKRKQGSPNRMVFAHTPDEPVAPPAVNLVNEGFEDGPEVGWVERPSGNHKIVSSGVQPTFGKYGAWLGGHNNALDRLEQRITSVPAGAALTFSTMIATNETTTDVAYDNLRVRIFDGLTGEYIDTRARRTNLAAKGTWLTSRVDLSDLAGRSVHVSFEARTDDARVTSFFVDNVRLEHP